MSVKVSFFFHQSCQQFLTFILSPESNVMCYDCDSRNDTACADPFNVTAAMMANITTRSCHGCCVKVVRKKHSRKFFNTFLKLFLKRILYSFKEVHLEDMYDQLEDKSVYGGPRVHGRGRQCRAHVLL